MESLARTGLTIVAALTAMAPLTGTFALLGGTPHVAAEMTFRQAPNGTTTFDIFETKDQATQPIRGYDTDMTQVMHFIIISDDFTQFMHVHPSYNAKTGHFTVTARLDPQRQYVAFADAQPIGVGEQVFRFLIQAQQTGRMALPATTTTSAPITADTPSPTTSSVGPYSVAIGTTTLQANAEASIAVTIQQNGKLAADLHPYLGAAAHAVFVDTATLEYLHVHPVVKGASDTSTPEMSMHDAHGAGAAGPQLVMHVPALPVGTYKLWLQFQGRSGVYAAPFTIVAR